MCSNVTIDIDIKPYTHITKKHAVWLCLSMVCVLIVNVIYSYKKKLIIIIIIKSAIAKNMHSLKYILFTENIYYNIPLK